VVERRRFCFTQSDSWNDGRHLHTYDEAEDSEPDALVYECELDLYNDECHVYFVKLGLSGWRARLLRIYKSWRQAGIYCRVVAGEIWHKEQHVTIEVKDGDRVYEDDEDVPPLTSSPRGFLFMVSHFKEKVRALNGSDDWHQDG